MQLDPNDPEIAKRFKRGKHIVIGCAVAIVLLSAALTKLSLVAFNREMALSDIVRFSFALVLAHSLIQGYPWARPVASVLAGLLAAIGIVSFVLTDGPFETVHYIMMPILAFYLAIAIVLAGSKNVVVYTFIKFLETQRDRDNRWR